MNGRLVLVSDLHLGGGPEAAAAGPGFADPFDQDDAFVQFLGYLRRREEGGGAASRAVATRPR